MSALCAPHAAARRGFTLIELLVVVAIIAMLISILVPALGRARQQGRAVVCESNLRMLAFAVQMYADANKGWFPEWGYAHGGGEAKAGHAWINTMSAEYGRQRDLLRCTADQSTHWTRPVEGKLRRTSYAVNYYLSTGGEDNPLWWRDGHAYNRQDWLQRPAATIFFAELAEEGDYALTDHVHADYWQDFYPDDRAKAAEMVMIERHLGEACYGLADGHAERLPYEKTFLIQSYDGEKVNWYFNKYDPTVAR